MTDMAIYLEGGGDSSSTKTSLRLGIDAFLRGIKARARQKAWRWRTIPCGGRQQTYDAFMSAIRNWPNTTNVLLVDSEGPVATLPDQHLGQRDGWQFSGNPIERIHFMTQCMETWIVADPSALAAYYGNGFRERALPVRRNLEEEAKSDIAAKLNAATRDTKTKGAYHKTRHAPDLLARIEPQTVRDRCRHCDRLFTELARLIG